MLCIWALCLFWSLECQDHKWEQAKLLTCVKPAAQGHIEKHVAEHVGTCSNNFKVVLGFGKAKQRDPESTWLLPPNPGLQ